MYVGEIAELKIGPRFAYGSKGLKENDIEIPADATLHYTVELISVEPEPEIETMDVETRKRIGQVLKFCLFSEKKELRTYFLVEFLD